jgi:hypothetical protein
MIGEGTMANWGLNEVNLRHDELLRRAGQAQRDLEQRQAQPGNGQQRRFAWPDSIGLFLKRFASTLQLKDSDWNAISPSRTPKQLPSARES